MGEIVNLRLVRKAKRREVAGARAEGNRVAFGVSKVVRDAAETEAKRAARVLDGAMLDD